ncbi:hypothetical protein ACCO45_011614 [Purpureocillium lilacinum]|uniref:Uncharacterized protein n=1 Tax=Purpureocillium lilacinum TaxID=33203 RepID=A0ACC4DC95_PURLI
MAAAGGNPATNVDGGRTRRRRWSEALPDPDEHEAGDGDDVSSSTAEAELTLELATPLTPKSLAAEHPTDVDVEMVDAESPSATTPNARMMDQNFEMPTPPDDISDEPNRDASPILVESAVE